MKSILFLGLLLLSVATSFAHRGEYLAISRLEITETENNFVYSFYLENIKEISLTGVQVEFWINESVIKTKKYAFIPSDTKYIAESFSISKSLLNIEKDYVNIEITKLFDTRKDWGGWDSPNQTKQTNTLYSEFLVDAPWRMKRTDAQGNDLPLPLHFFYHDAQLVTGLTPQIDHIEIQLKNASSPTFGGVLKFNSTSSAVFASYFEAMSPSDSYLDVQGFDLSALHSSSSTTIDFDDESDFFNDYEEVDAEYWYFNFNIPPSKMVGMEDIIDVKVTINYGNFTFSDDVLTMRVFRSNENIPKLPKYYRGDTHLHSMYTQNDAEIGLPLEATKIAGKHIGLDWITTTDHTSDFDNYGGSIANNWLHLQNAAEALNNQDASLIYIAGQEVALNNHEGKLVHMLAYPSKTDPYDFPFMGDGDGDITSTNVSINSALSSVNAANGFAYAAHPFATADELPTIPVGGGIWNLGDPEFATNGSSFPETGGNIICNDPAASSDIYHTSTGYLIKNGLKGVQVWNLKNNLHSTGNTDDPWGILNSSDGFNVSDTAATSHHLKKFRQGLEIVNFVNQMGLNLKNQDTTYKNWKLYISAGADAHGSFNTSNTDNFGGFNGENTDNAVGKLTTAVYCPNGMKVDGSGILDALSKGRNILSDGPLMAFGISANGANASNEIQMGDDKIVNIDQLDQYFLNIDYATTTEFGDVTSIKFIVGTSTGEYTYAMPFNTLQGVNNIRKSLTDVLKLTFPSGTIPEDEYFYIRGEMQTLVTYNTAEAAAHHIGYGLHSSFTNPIWIKFTEVIPEVDELTVVVAPNPFQENFNLIVKTKKPQDITVTFYDKIGRLIYKEIQYVDLSKSISYSATKLGLDYGTYTIKIATDDESTSIQVVHI